MKVSRDEVAEMVLQGCLAPELEQLWEQGRSKQKLVIQLCDTVSEGSPEDLKVCHTLFTRMVLVVWVCIMNECATGPARGSVHLAVQGSVLTARLCLSKSAPLMKVIVFLYIACHLSLDSHSSQSWPDGIEAASGGCTLIDMPAIATWPLAESWRSQIILPLQQVLLGDGDSPYREVLQEGTCDLLTKRAPLHCAARLGKVLQLELLIEAGSPVDGLDGHGWTALQVQPKQPSVGSAMCLQCDAFPSACEATLAVVECMRMVQ